MMAVVRTAVFGRLLRLRIIIKFGPFFIPEKGSIV